MKSYAKMLADYGIEPIPYPELLWTVEWREKRACILARDDAKCRKCGCSNVGQTLHIHHEHYIIGRLPWDYPDELLVTICRACHQRLHDEHKVFVYEEINGKLVRRNLVPCSRCSGTGYFPQWDHIQHGVCFRCEGARFEAEELKESPWIGG